ncbi:acyltransferase [Candidatus Microgenomates bacterium]|nr:acyltransferase [Candidatus Microgenomates bacterium]
MEKKRFEQIDFLRAISIVGVVAIHVAAFNLSNTAAYFAWNYLQFVVVAFVFCSGYVLANRYNTEFASISQILPWLKKRFVRLLLPFYLYFLLHFSLWFLFPNLFSGFGLKKSFAFILNSLLLTGGVDLNWLPLLFIQLTLVFVVLSFIKKKTSYYLGYLFFSLLVCAFFTFFNSFSQFYRWTMWIPWSLVLLTAIKISSLEKQFRFPERKYVLFGSLLFSIFVILLVFFGLTDRSLIFRTHKYPPDLYYLAYSLGLTLFSIVLGKIKFFAHPIISRSFFYLSTNSYPLFFIHIIVLDFFFKNLRNYYFFSSWIVQFLTVLFLSVIIKMLIDKVIARLKSQKFTAPALQNPPQKDGFWNS